MNLEEAPEMCGATHIEVDADVRYWEDARVNGIVDSDGELIFGRDRSEKGNVWKIRINLAEGRIESWPADMSAEIHYKVCDAGLYWLTDADGLRLARWKGHYVPSAFLTHGKSVNSDYIVFTVTPSGLIEQYNRPVINENEWEVLSYLEIENSNSCKK